MKRMMALLVLLGSCAIPTKAELRQDPQRCYVWMGNAIGDAAGTHVSIEDGFATYDRGMGIHAKASYYVQPGRIGIDNALRPVEYASVDERGLSFDRWNRPDERATFDNGEVHLPGFMHWPPLYYGRVCSLQEAALGVAELVRAQSPP